MWAMSHIHHGYYTEHQAGHENVGEMERNGGWVASIERCMNGVRDSLFLVVDADHDGHYNGDDNDNDDT